MMVQGDIQAAARSDHKISTMGVVIWEVELTVSNRNFGVGLETAKAPPVSGTDQVVVFMNIELLVEAKKTRLAFRAQVRTDVEVCIDADP